MTWCAVLGHFAFTFLVGKMIRIRVMNPGVWLAPLIRRKRFLESETYVSHLCHASFSRQGVPVMTSWVRGHPSPFMILPLVWWGPSMIFYEGGYVFRALVFYTCWSQASFILNHSLGCMCWLCLHYYCWRASVLALGHLFRGLYFSCKLFPSFMSRQYHSFWSGTCPMIASISWCLKNLFSLIAWKHCG